jgi:hypothetical protein
MIYPEMIETKRPQRSATSFRMGDETKEGEGDAEGYARIHETDEEWNRRTGTKWRDDAQEGGENITYKLFFMG